MELFLGISILAVLAAMTFLSYTHPSAFRKIAYPLLAFSVLSILFVSVYNFGGIGVNVDNLIQEARRSDAEAAVMRFYAQRVSERYLWQIRSLSVGGAVSAYLILLLYLPRFTGRKKSAG